MMSEQRRSHLSGFRYHFLTKLVHHRLWHLALTALAPIAILTTPVAGDTLSDTDLLRAAAAADLRLESVGYRLTTANVALCRHRMPATGLRLQSLAGYTPGFRAAARQVFGFDTDAGVEGIVPGSPAAAAGIRAGDGIMRIESFTMPNVPPESATEATLEPLIALHAKLFALPPGQPIRMVVRRDGRAIPITVQPRPACRARFEVLLGARFMADADGETVRVGAGSMMRFTEGKLAATVAHEIAHNILDHARLSEEEGIKGGAAGEFGRSARLTRAMEDEADRLSLRLLANAGYDPLDAVTLWREDGATITRGALFNGSHRTWRSRARLLEAELAAMRADSER